jgi:hypothetical protein
MQQLIENKSKVTDKMEEDRKIPLPTQDAIIGFKQRYAKLSSEKRKTFMDHAFNNEHPFSVFQDSILNITNPEIRFNTFCDLFKEIGDKRAKIRLYFNIICEIGGYKQRPIDRITDSRAIEMFDKVPNAIKTSLNLIDSTQHDPALIQLTASNRLQTGYRLSNCKLVPDKKRKKDDTPATASKRQKVNCIDPEAVSYVLKHYIKKDDNEKTRKTLVNCDLEFWKTIQVKIFLAADPFETFMDCMNRVGQKDQKSVFVHGFLRPPEEYFDNEHIDKYIGMPIYKPSRDLLSGDNFVKVKILLRETNDKPHQTFFGQHMNSTNTVPIDIHLKNLLEERAKTSEIEPRLEWRTYSSEPLDNDRNRLFYIDRTEEIRRMFPAKEGDATKEDIDNYFKFWNGIGNF